MTDRVYPSSKPNGGAATPAATTPAVKPQFRHPYRPQPASRRRSSHRHRRSCLCRCCCWSILFIAAIILIGAVAGAAIYVLYHPQRPSFSLSSLKISKFNITTSPDDSTTLTTKLNLTLSSKNPNKKLIYTFDPIIITTLSNQIQIANGSFPSFISTPNNITIIHSTLFTTSQLLDAESVTNLKSGLKKKSGLPMKILLDTKVKVKLEGLKSKKIGIRVICEGINATIPKGKSPSIASISNSRCKVDLRVKIWKWTF